MHPFFEELFSLQLFVIHLCSHSSPNLAMHNFINLREYSIPQLFGWARGSHLGTKRLQVSSSTYEIIHALQQVIMHLLLENDLNLVLCIPEGRPCLGSVY